MQWLPKPALHTVLAEGKPGPFSLIFLPASSNPLGRGNVQTATPLLE
jgi:hypothetical protein